ncbi:MAG: FliO/MopB family protein [Rhizobiales bacterium]|nr:FliO/MopB family protein [Hyphomicrobiales bacterium]
MNLEAYDQYLTPAAIVLVGLVALWLILRLVGKKVTGRRGNRLAVSEFHEIDKSRRLVLVRRDDVEHLIMIGGAQDMVVESGIGDKSAARPLSRTETSPSLEVSPLPKIDEPPEQETIAKILPREPKPAVFGDRAPNLRPVERSEPRFDADKSTGESSS